MRLMMDILAALAKGLWQTIKVLFRRLRGLLLALMLVLNLGMIAVPMVYDMASRAFWGVVSIASASYALRNETRAERRASLDQIKADRDRAQRRAASALARLEVVKSDRSRLAAQAQGLEDELAESRAKVSGKVRGVQDRSKRALARNMGAAYAETIPVLGTLFVIGGIALDVWDTCQTMKDMHEIGRLIDFNSNGENEIETRWCGGELREVWAALGGGPTAPNRACIEARLHLGEIAPPECEGFEFPKGNPIRFADPQPEQVPSTPHTNPMRE